MSTIMPKEKQIQDALKWISERISENGKSEGKALEEAAFKFNLTPKQEEYLRHIFKQGGQEKEKQEA